MRKLALLIGAALASACVSSDDDGTIADASLQVTNASDFVIVEIYLTDVDSPDWGPNLLRGDVLLPDESLLLGVSCGFYDALIVDEDQVECELHDLDLCANDADWVIGNNTCSVFGAAKAARESAVGQVDQLRAAR
jgi:hypothetical protein